MGYDTDNQSVVDLPFTGRVDHNVFTANTDVRTSEMTKCSNSSNTRRINYITIVVQNMHINSNCPNSTTRCNTQRLRVDTVRLP